MVPGENGDNKVDYHAPRRGEEEMPIPIKWNQKINVNNVLKLWDAGQDTLSDIQKRELHETLKKEAYRNWRKSNDYFVDEKFFVEQVSIKTPQNTNGAVNRWRKELNRTLSYIVPDEASTKEISKINESTQLESVNRDFIFYILNLRQLHEKQRMREEQEMQEDSQAQYEPSTYDKIINNQWDSLRQEIIEGLEWGIFTLSHTLIMKAKDWVNENHERVNKREEEMQKYGDLYDAYEYASSIMLYMKSLLSYKDYHQIEKKDYETLRKILEVCDEIIGQIYFNILTDYHRMVRRGEADKIPGQEDDERLQPFYDFISNWKSDS
jgi:hypothetical protein